MTDLYQKIIVILKKYLEYRNYQPYKDIAELVGFDVEQWIRDGKP